MKQKIIEVLTEKHCVSGGNCGTYTPKLIEVLGVDFEELKPILNELYREQKLTIREGMNGRLLFLKN